MESIIVFEEREEDDVFAYISIIEVCMIKRKREIDIVKGIGIILMIMGHIEYGIHFDKIIHAFHMPLFFLISGFLHKKVNENHEEWISKKTRSLLTPYLYFGVFFLIMAAVQVIFNLKNSTELLDNIMHFMFINTEGLAIAGAIWYLTAIFFVEIIYFFIEHLRLGDMQKTILVIICFLIGALLGGKGIRLPWGIDVSLVGVLFFHVGKYYSYFSDKIEKTKVYMTVIMLGIALSCIYMNSSVNMRIGKYGNGVLFIIASISMSWVLYFIAYKLKEKRNYIINELEFIGKNSIVYLCLNEFVLFFLKRVFLTAQSSYSIEVALRVVILLIVTLVLHFASLFFNKPPFSIVIGQKKVKLSK